MAGLVCNVARCQVHEIGKTLLFFNVFVNFLLPFFFLFPHERHPTLSTIMLRFARLINAFDVRFFSFFFARFISAYGQTPVLVARGVVTVHILHSACN